MKVTHEGCLKLSEGGNKANPRTAILQANNKHYSMANTLSYIACVGLLHLQLHMTCKLFIALGDL